MSGEPTISFETSTNVCWVSMARPQAKNALNRQLLGELVDALGEYERRSDLAALVLSGSDCGAFSAGGDLKEVARRQAEDEPPIPDVFRALRDCPKPLIAAVDGHALGGGFEMAMLCDIRLATANSWFGMPEPRRGLMGDFGVDHLCRLVPLGEALRLHLTGASMPAVRAYQIGLIQEVLGDRADLFAKAAELAAQIALCSPNALRTLKHLVSVGRNLPIEYAREHSRPYRQLIFNSPDALEGTRAFVEKREPRWSSP